MTNHGRTIFDLNSFLPPTVRDWNNLPPEIAQYDSVALFKYNLNRYHTHFPYYFYSGINADFLHTRLRTQCSALSHDLFGKNILDTSLCRFGSVENMHHFFFKCHFYNIISNDLLHEVFLILLFYGNQNLTNDLNPKYLNQSIHTY